MTNAFRHPNLELILGPPGTGKTTTCLEIVEHELNEGTKPNKIGFVSFTRKATIEARERAEAKFGLTPKDLPWFRTIHSLAFRCLGLGSKDVMQRAHYRDLGKLLGVEISGYVNLDDGSIVPGSAPGDRMLFCDNLARCRRISLREQYNLLEDDDIPSWSEQEKFSRTLRSFKLEGGICDYTDMLERYVEQAYIPQLDVLIIDEAQDLSRLQWEILHETAKKSQRVYVAGDDDQAIYRWAGADVDEFLSLTGKQRILGHSFRLTRRVHELSHSILSRIKQRYAKPFEPRDEEGQIHWYGSGSEIDMSEGQWLILARNNYLLESLEGQCRQMGYSYETKRWSPMKSEAIYAIRLWEHLRKGHEITASEVNTIYRYITSGKGVERGFKNLSGMNPQHKFTMSDLKAKWGLRTDKIWHEALDRIDPEDRTYYVNVLRRGESLTQEPRIKLSTIHGAKGGEARNVVLLTDMSYRTFQDMNKNPDDEARVFYVGATRAIDALHIVEPETQRYYEI